MLSLMLLACKPEQDLQTSNQNPGVTQSCECTEEAETLSTLREELDVLSDRVAELETLTRDLSSVGVDLSERVTDLEVETTADSDLVVSSYVVDCGLGSLQAAWSEAYSAARAAGDVTGLEWSYNSCILVTGVPEGEMPIVSAYQLRGYQPDVTCDSTTLICTAGSSSNQYWLLSQTGGMDGSRNGYGEARVPPGSQLRYDMDRGIITTSSDMRQYKEDAANYWFVTIAGSKTYTAPVQPL